MGRVRGVGIREWGLGIRDWPDVVHYVWKRNGSGVGEVERPVMV